MPSM